MKKLTNIVVSSILPNKANIRLLANVPGDFAELNIEEYFNSNFNFDQKSISF